MWRFCQFQDKIKLNKQLPYLVGNIVEVRSAFFLRRPAVGEPPPPVLSFITSDLPRPVSALQILDVQPEDEEEEDGGNTDVDAQREGKCAVLKTSTRQTIFLPVIGLVDHKNLKPGDLVGVNKDSYLVLDMLPDEYDSRVKAMEVRVCTVVCFVLRETLCFFEPLSPALCAGGRETDRGVQRCWWPGQAD